MTRGLSFEDAERRLGKRLTLDSENLLLLDTGTFVFRNYSYRSEFGTCFQDIRLRVDNVDLTPGATSPGPLLVEEISKSEFGCSGIVK